MTDLLEGTEYPKIHSVYKRDPTGKRMLFGEYAKPEFQYLAKCQWEFTEKVDGTNVRLHYKDGLLTIGGRTGRAQMPVDLVHHLGSLFSPERLHDMKTMFPEGVVLYGEGYGGHIQKAGPCYGPISFILFDVRVGFEWLLRPNVESIADSLHLRTVPFVGTGTLHDMEKMVREGFKSDWPRILPEGIVARPPVKLFARYGERVITKLKLSDYNNVEQLC